MLIAAIILIAFGLVIYLYPRLRAAFRTVNHSTRHLRCPDCGADPKGWHLRGCRKGGGLGRT